MADLDLEVELIKKDISQISKLVDKFDVTIDKLQQVAVDITKIVSLQDQKIQQQDRINSDVDDEAKDVRRKVDDIEKNLSTKLTESETKILKELQNVKSDLDKKITALEAWRYMVMGIISVVVFVVSQAVGLAKFFLP
jgi:DNA repair exonuclease SbcCD ATPase subunit